jgi:hypothetical protein
MQLLAHEDRIESNHGVRDRRQNDETDGDLLLSLSKTTGKIISHAVV